MLLVVACGQTYQTISNLARSAIGFLGWCAVRRQVKVVQNESLVNLFPALRQIYLNSSLSSLDQPEPTFLRICSLVFLNILPEVSTFEENQVNNFVRQRSKM